MDDVQSATAEVREEIKKLGVKLDKVEADVQAARAREDKDEVAALRKKEEQLRTEKEQLRAKELLLMQGMLASLVPLEALALPSDAARTQADPRCKRTRLAWMLLRRSLRCCVWW
jgi:hypothetical protein